MDKEKYKCKYCGKKMNKFENKMYKGYCGKCRNVLAWKSLLSDYKEFKK